MAHQVVVVVVFEDVRDYPNPRVDRIKYLRSVLVVFIGQYVCVRIPRNIGSFSVEVVNQSSYLITRYVRKGSQVSLG